VVPSSRKKRRTGGKVTWLLTRGKGKRGSNSSYAKRGHERRRYKEIRYSERERDLDALPLGKKELGSGRRKKVRRKLYRLFKGRKKVATKRGSLTSDTPTNGREYSTHFDEMQKTKGTLSKNKKKGGGSRERALNVRRAGPFRKGGTKVMGFKEKSPRLRERMGLKKDASSFNRKRENPSVRKGDALWGDRSQVQEGNRGEWDSREST